MRQAASLVFRTLCLSLVVLVVPSLHAQITVAIHADIHHRFTVGQATLPPGQYVFRMMQHTDLSVMTVTSGDGNLSDEFLVRQSVDSHVPQHIELLFNRYGNNEFLTHVYQQGERIGISVVEPSREESRLQRQGQTPVEHTEEQEQ